MTDRVRHAPSKWESRQWKSSRAKPTFQFVACAGTARIPFDQTRWTMSRRTWNVLSTTRRPAFSREFSQREKDESVVEGNGRIGSNEFQYHLHHLLPDSSYRERFIGAKCLVLNNNSSSLELCNLIIVVELLRKSFDLLPPVSLYIYPCYGGVCPIWSNIFSIIGEEDKRKNRSRVEYTEKHCVRGSQSAVRAVASQLDGSRECCSLRVLGLTRSLCLSFSLFLSMKDPVHHGINIV